MQAMELFERVYEALTETKETATAYKMLHETLVLACHEGVADSQQAYGNLFSQVDFLCKQKGIAIADRIAIQEMRRHSNHPKECTPEDLRYDARALCLLISAIFHEQIPGNLTAVIPTENRQPKESRKMNRRYVRCIVQQWDDEHIYATTEQGTEKERLAIDYGEYGELKNLLYEGMQLNLLDVREGNVPGLIVVEPDFLVDISSIAACFQEYGHHPLLYTLNRMKPRPNTQATLLGNFAGTALDEAANAPSDKAKEAVALKKNFREKALEFCTCKGFNGSRFKEDAATQVANIEEVMGELRKEKRKTFLLEPSFVCEQLGIQGRVDLMTADMRLLVEQKSGRNMNIERQQPNEHGSFQLEPHYVQLLLYYGVLKQNFGLGNNQVDIRLLYSKYPAAKGLVVVAYYQKLFREAIRFRNQLVACELYMARNGFHQALDMLKPEILNVNRCNTTFFQRYLLPELQQLTIPLHQLSELERAYYTRMMTFVYREQRVAKMGAQEGVTGSCADLWNMPLSEKRETGNIYTGLSVTSRNKRNADGNEDLITLNVPAQGDHFLPNFRRGDMVYLYAYGEDEEPDVRKSILYRGVLKEIHTTELTVCLNYGMGDMHGDNCRFAIEHSHSDTSAHAAIRSLYELMTAPRHRRDLLLGQRQPHTDSTLALSRNYHPHYDEIILKAKQAQDYYLIVGPPGTGKTSMALQFLVREHLASTRNTTGEAILLMAYTNRAVDEICAMLADNNIDFLRLGNEYSCDSRFRPNLMEQLVDDCPKLSVIRQRMADKNIIVGTTSMLMAKPFIFDIKHFGLAVVDEASQILEPNIVGLLAAHRDGRCCIDKFILIGDHKQLPAVVQQSEQDAAVSDPLLHGIGLYNCRNSLFERLQTGNRHSGTDGMTGILRRQGRMHPDLAAFPNRMFYAREQLEPVPLPHQERTSTSHLLMNRRRVFIPSRFCREPDMSDKVNTHEAQIVAQLLKDIRQHYGSQFNANKTVGVIVPYRNQIAMIRKEMEKLGIEDMEQVSIDTVERYQGSQRDVIIYSFTVQHLYQLDFLTNNCMVEDGQVIDRKLNVAITRAREQMIITGNEQILSANPLFRQLIEDFKS